MDGFIKALVDKFPPWSYHAFAAIICIGLIFYFYKTYFINKKFNELVTDVLKRDDRTKSYQERIDILTEENNKHKNDSSQLFACIVNLKQYLDVLNEIRLTDDQTAIMQETNRLLQRLTDSLAFDIKALSGEQHRCGLWAKNDQNNLLLVISSSGFPKSYIGSRMLDINRSIAGRCFRKNQSINCVDVTKDEDWKANELSKSPYKALICIPISGWGVLTLDALHPLNDKCLQICEAYGSIAFGVMVEYYKAESYFEENTDFEEDVS